MSKFEYDKVVKYQISAKTNSPLHIGGALGGRDEILSDPVTGSPFIQASSLAGMFRNASEVMNGIDVTNELFGSPRKMTDQEQGSGRSRVRITDGRMVQETVKLEIRPGIAVDRKTGTVNSKDWGGQKFDMTYVSADAVFSFCMYLYIQKSDNELQDRLESLLGIMKSGGSTLGAKKSSGAGKFSASSVKRAVFDLTSDDDRRAWISETNSKIEETDAKIDYEDITDSCVADNISVKYDIEVEAESEGPIQIRGIAMTEFGENAPDSENIRNGDGEFIVPGTSVRGAIRDQMEKIAKYQGKERVIGTSFGFNADKHSESKCGNLVFNDAVIGKEEDIEQNPVRNRIHIDKFTGGVIGQAFFKEKNASGNVNISIQIQDRNNPDATLGLLIYALRDLALNIYNFGNGYATGKGFLNVSRITVRYAAKKAEILFAKDPVEIKDETGILQNALNALREVQG